MFIVLWHICLLAFVLWCVCLLCHYICECLIGQWSTCVLGLRLVPGASASLNRTRLSLWIWLVECVHSLLIDTLNCDFSKASPLAFADLNLLRQNLCMCSADAEALFMSTDASAAVQPTCHHVHGGVQEVERGGNDVSFGHSPEGGGGRPEGL